MYYMYFDEFILTIGGNRLLQYDLCPIELGLDKLNEVILQAECKYVDHFTN